MPTTRTAAPRKRTPRQRLRQRYPKAFSAPASDGVRVYLAPDETIPLSLAPTARQAWATAASLDAMAHLLQNPHGPCRTAGCPVCA